MLAAVPALSAPVTSPTVGCVRWHIPLLSMYWHHLLSDPGDAIGCTVTELASGTVMVRTAVSPDVLK